MIAHIIGIVLLDSDGTRIIAQYASGKNLLYSKLFSTVEDQKRYEKDLLIRSLRLPSRNEVEVLIANETIALYKLVNDVNIYLIGIANENEIWLLEVINTFYNTLHSLTNGNITKRNIEDNLGSVFLLLDELLEDDAVFETDSNTIINRIQMNSQEETKSQEQTAFNQALYNAKEVHYPEIRPDQPYVAVVPTSQKEPFSVKKRISQFSSAPKENAQATTLRPTTDESGQVTSETSSSSEAIDKRKQEIDSLEKQLEGLRNIESSLQNAVETRTGLQYNTASGTLQRRNENLQLENQIRAQKEEQDLAEEEKKLNERKNESEEEVEDEMLQAKMSHKDTTEDLRDFLEDIKEDVKKDVEQTLKNQLQSKMGKQIEKLAKEVENKEEKEEEAVETEDSLQSKSAVDSFDMDEKNTAKAIEDLANNRRRMGKELQEQEDAEAQREAKEEALKSSTTDNCVGDLMPQRKPVSNSQAYFLNNKRRTDSRITLPALKISDTTHFISQHDYSLLPEEVAEATPDGSLSGEHPVPRSSSKKLREMKNKKKNITAPHQPPFITAGHQGTDFFSYGSHPHEDKAHTANDAIHHKHQDPHHHNERREELNAIQWLYFIILFPLGVASSALTLVFFV